MVGLVGVLHAPHGRERGTNMAGGERMECCRALRDAQIDTSGLQLLQTALSAAGAPSPPFHRGRGAAGAVNALQLYRNLVIGETGREGTKRRFQLYRLYCCYEARLSR